LGVLLGGVRAAGILPVDFAAGPLTKNGNLAQYRQREENGRNKTETSRRAAKEGDAQKHPRRPFRNRRAHIVPAGGGGAAEFLLAPETGGRGSFGLPALIGYDLTREDRRTIGKEFEK
jgi:hypothetical protein